MAAALASAIFGQTMTRLIRITKGPDVGDILDSIESREAFARSHSPGSYQVDEHSHDPLPGPTSRPGRGAR
jgi:hypothetical protein